MSVQEDQVWITGEELGRERRRLIEAGVPESAPEYLALRAQIRVRDNYLFERYGKPLMDQNYGKWIAISRNGAYIIRETATEVTVAAERDFGGGDYCKRKLAEFPGHDILH